MKNKTILIAAILLIISIGNYFRISDNNVRTVEFVSILAIGMFAGVLAGEIIKKLKYKA
jgi:hypothetical protein